jgi:hypothetical protein
MFSIPLNIFHLLLLLQFIKNSSELLVIFTDRFGNIKVTAISGTREQQSEECFDFKWKILKNIAYFLTSLAVISNTHRNQWKSYTIMNKHISATKHQINIYPTNQ